MSDTPDKDPETTEDELPEGQSPKGTATGGGEEGGSDELQQLRKERDRLDNQLKHAMADLANFRKRQAKERLEIRHAVIEALAQELLPVLDNFRYALAADAQQAGDANQDGSAIIEGLRMVQTMLTDALQRHGLTEIPAEGQAFDPNVHEAVGVEARDGVEEGTILSVAQPGYLLGERVVRPSRVTVAGNGADETEE